MPGGSQQLANLDLSYGDLYEWGFRDRDAFGTSFQHANLQRSLFRNVNLRDANFDAADLTEARIEGRQTILAGATLNGADLTGAYLGHLNLADADLSNTVLRNTELRRSDVRDAEFTGALLHQTSFERGPGFYCATALFHDQLS